MTFARLLFPILATALAPSTAAADYLGILKLPRSLVLLPDKGAYSFASSTQAPFLSGGGLPDSVYELKLGYKYSRFFSVEGQFNDFTRAQDPFSRRATTSPSFHGSGFGIDTVATLPVWRFSFYGKMGAYHGEAAQAFSPYSTALLGEARGTRLRYGLGMRYNVTRSIGVEAQMERYAPLGSPLAGEPESDLFSVGLNWRF